MIKRHTLQALAERGIGRAFYVASPPTTRIFFCFFLFPSIPCFIKLFLYVNIYFIGYYLRGEGGERPPLSGVAGDWRWGERRGLSREESVFLLPLSGSAERFRESLGFGEDGEEEEGWGEEEAGLGEGEPKVEWSLGTTIEILGTVSGDVVEDKGLERSSEELLAVEGRESASSSPSRGALVLRLRSIPNFIFSSSNFRVGFFSPGVKESFSFCAAFCVCASSFCKVAISI
jgi:hypothetical protein